MKTGSLSWGGRKGRRLSVLGKQYVGLIDSPLPGIRTDCEQEGTCPTAFATCFSGQEAELSKINIVVLIEPALCDDMASESECMDYARSVVGDANRTLMRQLGLLLNIRFIFPTSTLKLFTNILPIDGSFNPTMLRRQIQIAFGCSNERQDTFLAQYRGETGFIPMGANVAFHLYILKTPMEKPAGTGLQEDKNGHSFEADTNGAGEAQENICNCRQVVFVSYKGDEQGKETWLSLVHQVGHVFGHSMLKMALWELEMAK